MFDIVVMGYDVNVAHVGGRSRAGRGAAEVFVGLSEGGVEGKGERGGC